MGMRNVIEKFDILLNSRGIRIVLEVCWFGGMFVGKIWGVGLVEF